MRSFGLNLTVEKKEKLRESNISSAFLKGSTKEHLHTALICMICFPCLPKIYTQSSAARGKIGSREETCTTIFSCLQRARLSIWSICAHVLFSPTASHPDAPCDLPEIKRMLCERFDTIDFTQARQDVEPFIRDRSSLDLWSADFFKQITENLRGQ